MTRLFAPVALMVDAITLSDLLLVLIVSGRRPLQKKQRSGYQAQRGIRCGSLDTFRLRHIGGQKSTARRDVPYTDHVSGDLKT